MTIVLVLLVWGLAAWFIVGLLRTNPTEQYTSETDGKVYKKEPFVPNLMSNDPQNVSKPKDSY